MKAFIFNSGRGSRLGALTAERPKALVSLATGETLLARQLRLLHQAGVTEVVISTGYRGAQICEAVQPFAMQGDAVHICGQSRLCHEQRHCFAESCSGMPARS